MEKLLSAKIRALRIVMAHKPDIETLEWTLKRSGDDAAAVINEIDAIYKDIEERLRRVSVAPERNVPNVFQIVRGVKTP